MAGKLIEENETMLRQQIEKIFFQKTKDIVFRTRMIDGKGAEEERKSAAKQLMRLREETTKTIDLS